MKKTPRQFASEALESGDPAGWFDPLYRQAGGDMAAVPWARGALHPLLEAWLAGVPWPLSRAELRVLEATGLTLERFEERVLDVGPQPRHVQLSFRKG